jgi:DNA polymerase-1
MTSPTCSFPRFESEAEGGTMQWLCDYQRVLVNAFIDIESTGFPFDPLQHREFINNAERIYVEYEEKLRDNSRFQYYCEKVLKVPSKGKKAFNLNSSAQLRGFLFSDKGLGLTAFKFSKTTKNPSTDRESLEKFAEYGNEFCQDLLVLRNFSKLLSSFGEPLLEFYSPITGAVHPNYFLAKVVDGSGVAGGTHTGRLSCKNPNLQQIPKRGKDDKGLGLAGVDVRRSFIPFPGDVLVEIDQSQIEVRVAGMYAKDEKMGEFFKAGGDFHSRVAAQVFKKDYETIERHRHNSTPAGKQASKYRGAAKQFTFGLMFGMGLTSLTRQSGLTETEGRKFIVDYFDTFPAFAKWREEMIAQAQDTGRVTTLFGRNRVINLSGFISEDGREQRIGINTPIQSAAADITLFGIARVWEFLVGNNYKTKILGTIHDSTIFSMPPEDFPLLSKIAHMMMRPPGLEWLLDNVPVPLSVGIDMGHNFRDMVEVPLSIVLHDKFTVLEDYT